MFERAADRLGRPPPVIRGEDIQRRPEAALRALTAALGLAFDPAMLAWPTGPKPYDGVWASHWYDRVRSSNGFAAPADAPAPDLPDALKPLAEAGAPLYRRLERYALDV